LRELTKDDFQSSFRNWQECWNKWIEHKGVYSEGDYWHLEILLCPFTAFFIIPHTWYYS
jgi:hypothetical protein